MAAQLVCELRCHGPLDGGARAVYLGGWGGAGQTRLPGSPWLCSPRAARMEQFYPAQRSWFSGLARRTKRAMSGAEVKRLRGTLTVH